MEKNKLMLGALVVVVLMGILLVGGSITGMVAGDYTKPVCSSDSDCSGENVCCLFFEQETGVCNEYSMCEQINWLTKEGANIQTVPAGENPAQENYVVGIIIGLLIMGVAGYAILGQEYVNKKKLDF